MQVKGMSQMENDLDKIYFVMKSLILYELSFLACDSGSYGKNCSKSCGQCSNDTCDHVNGTCTSECKAGYRTNLCNISTCFQFTYI